MNFIPKNYFGLNLFLIGMTHYIQKNNNNLPLWDKVQQEALPRLASAAGAYWVLPQCALLGAVCQLSLGLYKFSVYVIVPSLRRTHTDSRALLKPIEECAEHLIRASYNLLIFFFRRLTTFAFLFPYEILSLHESLEGKLTTLSGPDEDPYIKKWARFGAGLLMGQLQPQDDIRQQLREQFSYYSAQAQGLFQVARHIVAERLAFRTPQDQRSQERGPPPPYSETDSQLPATDQQRLPAGENNN